KFHSLVCTVYDKELFSFDECRIKAINRFQNSVTISGTLKKTLSTVQINFRFLKRERGGWHPFLYAMTVDACKYFESPIQYPIPNLVFYYMKEFTNVNHTCPYMVKLYLLLFNCIYRYIFFKVNTSLTMRDWRPDGKSFIGRFPIDWGEYALHTVFYADKKKFISMNGSIEIFKTF
ncbi:hypothetical protein KR222_001237, partial [Zaprionus bogoriensis]